MGNSTKQASMKSTSKDDDWTKVEDRAARRKIQNRRAQRRHREKIREHIAQLQAQVASASRDSTPTDHGSESYDRYPHKPSSSRPQCTAVKQEHPSPSEAMRMHRQEHDSSHMQEDTQNVVTDPWNSTWPYFSNNDIFDNVYPPTPPQELSTSPIICSALPHPSHQRFPQPHTPASRSPRPPPIRSMTSPQLPVADRRNRTRPQANRPSSNYPGALSIKWDEPSSIDYSGQDESMPQLSYPQQIPQAPIRGSLSSRDAANHSNIICAKCAQQIDLEGHEGGVRYIAIPADPNDA